MNERIPVIATGYANEVEVSFSADPKEYRGLDTPTVSKKLYDTARSIRKDVSFFPQDFDAAAEAIVEANGE